MTGQVLLAVSLSMMFFHQASSCQPAPTTIQQVGTLVADSPMNAPQLITVEPARVPIAPVAPVQSIFELLKIPIPTLPSSQPSTTNTSNISGELEVSNSTVAVDESTAETSLGPVEMEQSNGTESSGDLTKELAQAEKSVISSFDNMKTGDIATGHPALNLFAVPQEEESKCERATITAITIMPYDDRLVGMDIDRMHEQIKLLEAYTQRTLLSFGEYSEEVTNTDDRFTIRYSLKNIKNCSDLRSFATKAVSYSREIERIQFSCNCEPLWVIAKKHSVKI